MTFQKNVLNPSSGLNSKVRREVTKGDAGFSFEQCTLV
jgi:hypothetical protein